MFPVFLGRRKQVGVPSLESLQVKVGGGHLGWHRAHTHKAWYQGAVFGGCLRDHRQPRVGHGRARE